MNASLDLPVRPLPGVPSVAVLVELAAGPFAGGHVKCWERFAEAAAALDPRDLGVDLTIYVLGEREWIQPLSPAVRYVALKPVVGTRSVVRLVGGVDATDFARYHPRLAQLLPGHDVWHLTHAFAFARTAVRLARDNPRARLVASVHTDVPALTAAYVRQTMRGIPGLASLAVRRDGRAGPVEWAAALARRRRDRLLRACERVLVASADERAEIAKVLGAAKVAPLGRGIDRERFRPDPGVRAALTAGHAVPPDRLAVLFVGRVDASKRIIVLAEAIRLLRDEGYPVHLVVAGSGSDAGRLPGLLGDAVTLLGPVPQDRLARIYAGCDVLAFPSRTETVGNVVAEAMACGLPVLLPAGARTSGWLQEPGKDGVLVADDTPGGWAAELARLVDRPDLRRQLAVNAAQTASTWHRSWEQVLREELLPVWRDTADRHAGSGDPLLTVE
ncbi:glycosyltransferase [Melissospora conviva]|uniref:glycosyltransferase n=1 Tax=Melissospora conviva TaxID=3388432 RepID=UPI003B7FAD81